jgi:hypothetical protein
MLRRDGITAELAEWRHRLDGPALAEKAEGAHTGMDMKSLHTEGCGAADITPERRPRQGLRY